MLQLRGVDPRIPFVLSSVALALVTCGLVAVERALAHRRDVAVDESTAAIVTPDIDTAVVAKKPSKTVFFAMALLAALAFQVRLVIDSAPLYRAHAPATLLPMLTPAFSIGFNVAMLPLALAVGRRPAARAMAAAAFVAAASAALATVAPTLPWLIAARLVTGVAWAGLVVAAFAWALARSGAGSAGAFAGALSAVLAQVVVRIGPPPPPSVEIVPAARPGYLWTPGYWNWRGNRHVWVNGTWVHERRGYLYMQPTWVQEGDRWRASGRAHGDAATATMTACRTATAAVPTTRVAPDRDSPALRTPSRAASGTRSPRPSIDGRGWRCDAGIARTARSRRDGDARSRASILPPDPLRRDA